MAGSIACPGASFSIYDHRMNKFIYTSIHRLIWTNNWLEQFPGMNTLLCNSYIFISV